MQFSSPVVAGISAGTLVLGAGITLLSLYLSGYLNKPVAPEEKEKIRTEAIVMEELVKAVDACKPEDFDPQGLIPKAIKTLSGLNKEEKVVLDNWNFGRTGRVGKSIYDRPNSAVAIRLFRVSLLFKELIYIKFGQCGTDEACIDKIDDSLGTLLSFMKKLKNEIIDEYGLKNPKRTKWKSLLERIGDDKDLKELERLYMFYLGHMSEFFGGWYKKMGEFLI